jgi:hypothetical protein
MPVSSVVGPLLRRPLHRNKKKNNISDNTHNELLSRVPDQLYLGKSYTIRSSCKESTKSLPKYVCIFGKVLRCRCIDDKSVKPLPVKYRKLLQLIRICTTGKNEPKAGIME